MWRVRLASNPEHFASMVGYELNKLDDVEVAAADKALALIARDIAKRRKALAGKLAEQRREQSAAPVHDTLIGPRSTMRNITIALLTTLATLAPAQAQDARIFHDAQGRVTGSARTDANGLTTFHDRVGRVIGTARTDRNGVTTFHDASGRATSSIRR